MSFLQEPTSPGSLPAQDISDAGKSLRTDGTSASWVRTRYENPDTTLLLQAESTAPLSAGNRTLCMKSFGSGISLPNTITPEGLAIPLQSHLGFLDVARWEAVGNSATIQVVRLNNTATGTAATVNVATTNYFTRTRRVRFPTTAAAGNTAGTRHNAAQWTIGSTTSQVFGGFYMQGQFGISQYQAGMACAAGMFANTASLPNADPATQLSAIFIGKSDTDANYHFFHNDSVGTCTKLDTGIIANTLDKMLRFHILAQQNSNSVQVSVEDNGVLAFSASITTDLPSFTTLLSPQFWVCNRAVAAIAAIDISNYYIEAY